jgi:predicted acetyltransferase
MTMHTHLQSVRVSTAAAAEKSTIAQLLQLYLHDFSEFAAIGEPYGDVGADGTFQYERLDSYWTDSRREPLLFRIDRTIVGFALVSDWSASGLPADYCMAEFFILRKYRRAGIGKSAASQIVRARRGIWEIPVADYNRPALSFWRSVVASMQGYDVAQVAGDRQRWYGIIWRLSVDALPRS